MRYGSGRTLRACTDVSSLSAVLCTSWVAGDRTRFESVMADRPGDFELVAVGAYFGWVRYPGELGTDDALRKLVVDHDVLAIPGTAFTEGDEHMLRISFANLDPEQIDRLGERLAEWSP